MKFYLLSIATSLCVVSTGFNFPTNAKDKYNSDPNYGELKQTESLSTRHNRN